MEFENDAHDLYDRAGAATPKAGTSSCKQPVATFEDFMQTTLNRSSADPGKAPSDRTSIREVSNKLSYPPKRDYYADSVISGLSNHYPGEEGNVSRQTKTSNRQGFSKQKDYAEVLAGSIAPCGRGGADIRSRDPAHDGTPQLSRQALVQFLPLSTEYNVGAKTHITVGTPSQGLYTPDSTSFSEAGGRSKGRSGKGRPEKHYSSLQQFDKTVTAELNKRKVQPTLHGLTLLHRSDTLESIFSDVVMEDLPSTRHNLKSTVSGAEIENILLSEKQQEKLLDVIEKFALADAACTFEGAVKAAEDAAANASPEDAEEAAATGARSYRADLIDTIEEIVQGEDLKPIEIVGYIGITNPKK